MPDVIISADHTSESDLILVKDGLALLGKRASLMPQAGFDAAITTIEVDVVPSGYCSAEVRGTADKPTLRIDSGLLSALRLASLLVARHFDQGLFRIDTVTEDTRVSFARLFRTFLGQYYLFGSFKLKPPDLSSDPSGKIAQLIAREATAFVLGHELGHVVAGHLGEIGATRWLDRTSTTERANDAAQEIEADALAVAVVLADLFGTTVPEGLADLRLLSIRMAYEVLSSVERCYLVANARSHLAADTRWEGVFNFLHRRFPSSTISRVAEGWGKIAEALRFPIALDFQSPDTSIQDDLALHGWPALSHSQADQTDWIMAEESSHQFRLHTIYQYALIGAEALGIQDLSAIGEGKLLAAGEKVVDALEEGLPRLLKGQSVGIYATPGVGDLVRHLRRREVWPEPFRSDTARSLPIHLAAGAIARRFSPESGF
jgi:hypothetical protein